MSDLKKGQKFKSLMKYSPINIPNDAEMSGGECCA